VATGAAVAVFADGLTRWAVDVTVIDDAVTRSIAQAPVPGLTGTASAIAEAGAAPASVIVAYALLLALIVLRRFRHLLVLLLSYEVLIVLTSIFLVGVHRPLPFGVLFRFRWGGFALPSVEIETVCAVLVGALYTLVPAGRWRRLGCWAAVVIVAVTGLSRMRLGVDTPTDVLLGAAFGVTVPLLALRLLAPEDSFPVVYGGPHGAHLDLGGARGEAIQQALKDQMGVEVSSVEPFGLTGSGGSSPMRLRRAGDPGGYLFGKLYARSHVRADRWYKLGRQLLHGRLEDEQSFKSVRRLVQQEDYALRLARDAGLPSPEPYGFVTLTPGREYLLVTEFFSGSAELGKVPVGDEVVDDGLLIVRKMWDAGLAHRDIKPANLLVRDGGLLVIDVAFTEVRPTPWREAVDLANMMLCLALCSSADRVYQRALRLFTVDEISEAFAADQGPALPGQLRQALRERTRPARGVHAAAAPAARAGPGAALERAPGGTVGRPDPGRRPAGPRPASASRPQRDPDHNPACQQHDLPFLRAAASRGAVGPLRLGGHVHPVAAGGLVPQPGPGAARQVGHHPGRRPGRHRLAAADPHRALRCRPGPAGPVILAWRRPVPRPRPPRRILGHLV
jgi:membrane-associated phospholipid phosphatase/tRNA A-37 threonylcarbamoyl transferase component Bud32